MPALRVVVVRSSVVKRPRGIVNEPRSVNPASIVLVVLLRRIALMPRTAPVAPFVSRFVRGVALAAEAGAVLRLAGVSPAPCLIGLGVSGRGFFWCTIAL